ncbi:protein of unknown function [Ruminococcaceae bacterium BL-4]|nr:protein of unknown function [Ruminococcaceae bacterium BL-4]
MIAAGIGQAAKIPQYIISANAFCGSSRTFSSRGRSGQNCK